MLRCTTARLLVGMLDEKDKSIYANSAFPSQSIADKRPSGTENQIRKKAYRSRLLSEEQRKERFMKKPSSLLALFFFFILGTFLFSSTAYAYIDPSSMTYIVQIVVGIIIAGGAAFGFYLKRIKRRLVKKNKTLPDIERHEKIAISDADDDEFSESNLSDDDFEIKHNKK